MIGHAFCGHPIDERVAHTKLENPAGGGWNGWKAPALMPRNSSLQMRRFWRRSSPPLPMVPHDEFPFASFVRRGTDGKVESGLDIPDDVEELK
jgi:hypothetical protein